MEEDREARERRIWEGYGVGGGRGQGCRIFWGASGGGREWRRLRGWGSRWRSGLCFCHAPSRSQPPLPSPIIPHPLPSSLAPHQHPISNYSILTLKIPVLPHFRILIPHFFFIPPPHQWHSIPPFPSQHPSSSLSHPTVKFPLFLNLPFFVFYSLRLPLTSNLIRCPFLSIFISHIPSHQLSPIIPKSSPPHSPSNLHLPSPMPHHQHLHLPVSHPNS